MGHVLLDVLLGSLSALHRAVFVWHEAAVRIVDLRGACGVTRIERPHQVLLSRLDPLEEC